MPETTADKDHFATRRKDEIGRAGHLINYPARFHRRTRDKDRRTSLRSTRGFGDSVHSAFRYPVVAKDFYLVWKQHP